VSTKLGEFQSQLDACQCYNSPMNRPIVISALLVALSILGHAQPSEIDVQAPIRPGVVVDTLGAELSETQLLILGESTHHMAEYQSLLASTLLQDLHDIGFRYYLAESPHACGWIEDLYASGQASASILPIDSFANNLTMLNGIRSLNSSLPRSQQIRYEAIDINHNPLAFRFAVHTLGDYIDIADLFVEALDAQFGDAIIRDMWDFSSENPTREQVSAYYHYVETLATIENEHASVYDSALRSLLDLIRSRRIKLLENWGSGWYDIVLDLVEVEITSLEIRQAPRTQRRQLDPAAAKREEVMVRNATRILVDAQGRAVTSLGEAHAFRRPFAGNRGIFESFGHALSQEFTTYHVLALAISGSTADGVVVFDHRDRYPSEDLCTILSKVGDEPSLVTLTAEYADDLQFFRATPIIPSQAYDAYLVLPSVTPAPLTPRMLPEDF
jgi:hypothetical protein